MMVNPDLFSDNIEEQENIKTFVYDLVAYNLLCYGVSHGSGSFFDLVYLVYWE